jgi:uncharacterized FAD-dependent dehydrogenase
MHKQVDIRLLPEHAGNPDRILRKLAQKTGIQEKKIKSYQINRRSIDARGAQVVIQLRITISDDQIESRKGYLMGNLKHVSGKPEVVIIGAGPAGYFAALELIELGLRPVIFERGKKVRDRRRDLRAIQQDGIVHPHSNYCFGEGGAGTYSDGKLYTRAHKRGKIEKVLQWFVEHGASEDILIDAHPHIGSNKLPKIVESMRDTIEKFGGEVRFNCHVNDFVIENEQMKGISFNENEFYGAEHVILATGHSARDIFTLLKEHRIDIEFKPFALGVRIEHPQSLIDEIQYRQSPRSEYLPASSYGLTCQINKRGVFSFCMCPGGLIVPAATAPGEIVVNGMSLSKRDSPFANAGTVVSVEAADVGCDVIENPLAGVTFQSKVEKLMFGCGDGSQKAPAQRMTDFLLARISDDLPDTSYIPGVFPAPVNALLPHFIYKHLKEAIFQFDRKMHGYLTEEAIIIGTESRTSSPVRIPREKETMEHPTVKGLYPCGEGAGYAGGIVSAAMDGQRVAQAISVSIN